MKKLFFAMAAMAAMLTSCSKDDTTTAPIPQRSQVTFTVNAPELSTRAEDDYGTGLTAKTLDYVIYDLAEAEGKNQITGTVTFPDNSLRTEVTVDLVEGREYEAIFFAHAPESPYTFNKTEQTMTINTTNLKANAETYDAFFKYVEPFVMPTNGMQQTVVMTRPFAQLNVATNDYQNEEIPAGKMIDAATTGVEVEAYNTLNLVDGTVSGKETIIYALANKMNGTIDAGGKDYSWLTMNYILVNAKENVGVKFHFTDVDGNNATRTYTREYTAVPVQRNHKTNIIGSILTSETKFNVEINPGFETPEYDYNDDKTEEITTTIQDLQTAINKADNMAGTEANPNTVIIKLTADGNSSMRANTSLATRAGEQVTIKIVQKAGLNLIIDGCGNKFDGKIEVNGDGRSTGKETLTFTNIKFSTASADKFTFIDSPSKINGKYNYSHNVTIVNCTFEYTGNAGVEIGSASFTGTYNFAMTNCTATNMHSLLQVQSCDNTAKVNNVKVINGKNGVSFGNTAYPTLTNSTIEAREYGVRADGDASRGNLVIENTTIDAKQPVIIRKVTTDGYSVALKGQNALNASEKYQIVFTKDSDDKAYVAPTTQWSITGAEDFNVYPTADEEGFKATSSEQLATLLSEGVTEVTITEGEYKFPTTGFTANTVINCEEGTVFTGNSKLNIKGATVIGATFSNPKGTAVDQTINGKFEDCKFTGVNALRWCYAGETVEFVNCEFSGSTYGVHFDGGANKAIFRDCTFSGFNAFGAEITSLTLENCTFKSNGISSYNGANLWGSTTLKGCKFIFDGSANYEWIDCVGEDKAYSFEDCIINGVKYTSDNYGEYSDYIDGYTIKINGVDCAFE